MAAWLQVCGIIVSDPVTFRLDNEQSGIEFLRVLLFCQQVVQECRRVGRDRLKDFWSGREDSNLRPPAPKAGALPGCATPRHFYGNTLKVSTVLAQLVGLRSVLLTLSNEPRQFRFLRDDRPLHWLHKRPTTRQVQGSYRRASDTFVDL